MFKTVFAQHPMMFFSCEKAVCKTGVEQEIRMRAEKQEGKLLEHMPKAMASGSNQHVQQERSNDGTAPLRAVQQSQHRVNLCDSLNEAAHQRIRRTAITVEKAFGKLLRLEIPHFTRLDAKPCGD